MERKTIFSLEEKREIIREREMDPVFHLLGIKQLNDDLWVDLQRKKAGKVQWEGQWSFVHHAKDNQTKTREGRFLDLMNQIWETNEQRGKDGLAILGAVFGTCPQKGYSRRLIKLAEHASLFGFDYDSASAFEELRMWLKDERLPGISVMIHASPSDGIPFLDYYCSKIVGEKPRRQKVRKTMSLEETEKEKQRIEEQFHAQINGSLKRVQESAFILGQMVGVGLLDREKSFSSLKKAVHDSVLPQALLQAKIPLEVMEESLVRGLNDGEKEPFDYSGCGQDRMVRFRVWVPLARPLSLEEHQLLYPWLFQATGEIDQACKDITRLFYTTRTHPNSERGPWIYVREGVPLDPDHLEEGVSIHSFFKRKEEEENLCKVVPIKEKEKGYLKKNVENGKEGKVYENEVIEARRRCYASKSLEGMCDEIKKGEKRNNILNRVAWKAARMVAAGYLDEGTARHRLACGAYESGLEEEEILKTIESSFKSGLSNPWDFTKVGIDFSQKEDDKLSDKKAGKKGENQKLSDPLEYARTRMEVEQIQCPYGYLSFYRQESGMKTVSVQYDKEGKILQVQPIAHVPVWISAFVSNVQGELTGLFLQWEDRKKNPHASIFEYKELLEPKSKAFAGFVNRGLAIVPSKKARFYDYLSAYDPDRTVLLVDRILAKQIKDRWVWALPYALFQEKKEPISLYPPDNSRLDEKKDSFWQPCKKAGQLWKTVHFPYLGDALKRGKRWRIWQEKLSQFLLDPEASSSRKRALSLRCATVTTALSAVVRPLMSDYQGWDGWGLHFYGQGGSGKSTLVQLAASMVAHGGRPDDPRSFTKLWHGTLNGLEAEANTIPGLPYCLDELKADTLTKGLGSFIYLLITGEGKARAKQDGELRERATLQKNLVSSGEIAIKEALQRVGQEIKEGQAVRLIDIEVDRSLWNGKEESDACQAFCAKHWGFALSSLLNQLSQNPSAAVERLNRLRQEAKRELDSSVYTDNPTLQRMQDRFASMIAVGEYTVEIGILPYSVGLVTELIIEAYRTVIETQIFSEGDLAIVTLRDQLDLNLHLHFDVIYEEESLVCQSASRERYGFYFKDEGMIGLSNEGLRILSGDRNHKIVAKALDEKGLLKEKDKGRLQKQRRIGGDLRRLYMVDSSIFEWSYDSL